MKKYSSLKGNTAKIIVGVMIMLMLVPMVSSLEFDNVKSYDHEKREATFKDSFLGIPTTEFAKIMILTPHNNQVPIGNDVLVAKFNVTLYDNEYKEFSKAMEFYDVVGFNRPIERNYKWKVKNTETQTYNTYDTECTPSIAANGTAIEICEDVFAGTELRELDTWTELTPKDLKKGTITLGLFTDTQKGDYVEFIPTLFGVRVPEWAVWTADLNTNILAYWSMTNDTATNIPDLVTGKFNQTIQGTCNMSESKVGTNGLGGNGANCAATHVANPRMLNVGKGDMTVSLWVKNKQTITDNGFIINFGNTGTSGAGDKGMVFLYHNEGADKATWFGNFYDTANTEIAEEGTTGTQNVWYHYVMIRNATNSYLYKDNVLQTTILNYSGYNLSAQTVSGTNGIDILLRGTTNFRNHAVDEVGVWNRALTEAEVTQLYNGGTGITYSSNFPAITSVLSTPLDTTNSSSATQTFTCNATVTQTNLVNNTLTIWSGGTLLYNVTNSTINPLTNSTAFSYTFAASGNYTWNCLLKDTSGIQAWAAANFSLSLDFTAPTLSIVEPTSGNKNTNITRLNYTATDTHLQACWYSLNGGTNTTNTCGSNVTDATSIEGSNTWVVYANDTFGNVGSSSVTFFKDTINPHMAIVTPTNGQNFSYHPSVNYTATDTNIGSCWYSKNGAANVTLASCGTNLTGLTWSSGNNNVTVYANDSVNNINSSTVTFAVDMNPPSLTITSPTTSQIFKGTNQTLNYSVSDAETAVGSCWYLNPMTGSNLTIGSCLNTSFTLPRVGDYTLYLYANDSAGNLATTSVNITLINLTTETYVTPALEYSTNTFSILLNRTSNVSVISKKITYNNTDYTTGIWNNSNLYYVNITVPTVSAITLTPFYWTFNLTYNANNVLHTSDLHNQSVNPMVISTNCTGHNSTIVSFTVLKEVDYTSLSNPTQQATFTIWALNTSISDGNKTFSFNMQQANATGDDNNTFSYCMFPEYGYYNLLGVAITSRTGFDPREYWLDQTVSNTTSAYNTYLLEANLSTVNIMTVNDEYEDGIEEALVSVQKYDASTDTYRTLQIVKTDSNGQSVVQLQWYDILYRYVVTKDRVVKLITTPAKIAAEDLTLRTSSSFVFTHDKFYDTSWSMTYVNASKTFELTYINPSGQAMKGCLRVLKMDLNNFTTLCDNCSTSASDTRTCYIGANPSGQYVASFYGFGSNYLFGYITEYIEVATRAIGYATGTIMAVIIGGTTAMLALASPVLSLVFFIGGLALSVPLGMRTFDLITFVGIAIVGGIIAYKANSK